MSIKEKRYLNIYIFQMKLTFLVKLNMFYKCCVLERELVYYFALSRALRCTRFDSLEDIGTDLLTECCKGYNISYNTMSPEYHSEIIFRAFKLIFLDSYRHFSKIKNCMNFIACFIRNTFNA